MMNEMTLNEAEQRTILNEAQLGILRLLGRLKTVEQVNELRQIISNYYAQKATEEMTASGTLASGTPRRTRQS